MYIRNIITVFLTFIFFFYKKNIKWDTSSIYSFTNVNVIFESLHEIREQFHTFLVKNNKELTNTRRISVNFNLFLWIILLNER